MEEFIKVPAWLLEGSSGAVATAFFFVSAGMIVYLSQKTKGALSLRTFYHEVKPALALFCAFLGIAMRIGDIWMRRYFYNHNLGPVPWTPLGGVFLMLGSIMAILGALCWLRVSLPRACGRRTWVFLLLASLVFGFAPALLPAPTVKVYPLPPRG